MEEFWITQSVYLLRMSGAVISGFLIGYERESSLKMAGVRTHVIVALTAALMILIPAAVVSPLIFISCGALALRSGSAWSVSTFRAI